MSSRTDALAALRTWVYAELGGAGGISNAIYAEQAVADAPRPALPYVTIEQTADVAMSAAPHETCVLVPAVGTPGQPGYVPAYYLAKRWQRRRASVSLAYYGPNGVDKLAQLRDSLRRITEKSSPAAALRTAGVAVFAANEITDTTALRSTTWEPSALEDWYLYYVNASQNTISIIETVSAPVTVA